MLLLKNRSQNGFTLAEILIVLTVISIISTVSIPALINNIDDAKTSASVKEAYAIMNQAYTKLTSDSGGTIKGLCSTFNDICLKNLFRPYLDYIKDCVAGGSIGVCKTEDALFLDNSSNSYATPSFVLKNGMLVEFRMHNKNCDYTDAYTSNAKCGWFAVDINGNKKPNKYGKDTFWFSLQENSIKPGGSLGDCNNFLNCEGTTGSFSGWGCTAKYIKQ